MSWLAFLSDAVAEFVWTSAAVAVGAVLAFVLPRTLGRIAHIAESAGWDVHGSWRRRQHPEEVALATRAMRSEPVKLAIPAAALMKPLASAETAVRRDAALASLASDTSTSSVAAAGPASLLPAELWPVVGSFLDARSLARFGQSCRASRACAGSPHLWASLLEGLGVVVEGAGPTAGPRLLYARARAAIATNEAFYCALRERDLASMASLWLQDRPHLFSETEATALRQGAAAAEARAAAGSAALQSVFKGLLRDYPQLNQGGMAGRPGQPPLLRPYCRHPGRPEPVLGWQAVRHSWAQIFASRALEIWPEERILSSHTTAGVGPGIASRNDFLWAGDSSSCDGGGPSASASHGWSIVVHDALPDADSWLWGVVY